MKKVLSKLSIFMLVALYTFTANAQWPAFTTANVPLTPDGDPDMEGPTPRTADGRPDLSGIWERFTGFAASEASAQEDQERPPGMPSVPPTATFFDLGANMDAGLPYQDWARELREERIANDMKDNPDANCLPMGFTQLHLHPQPRKIIQLPELIVMLWEGNSGIRQIFMDGRELPDNNPLPWWYGYSIGHWEGDTLVVESNGFREGGWLDVNGSPLTTEGKIIERFTRDTYGHMIVDITIDDPKAYTEPFTVRVEQGVMLNTNLFEFICLENEQSTRYFDP